MDSMETEGREGPGDGGAGGGAGAEGLERHAGGMYTHPEDPGEPTTGKPRVSVTDHEGAILAWLAHDRRVLEVGTGLGVSTRAMAAQAYCVYTVDVDPWVHEHVWPSLPEDVQKGKTLPPWGDDPGMHSFEHYFNLVFIDGDHEEEAVLRDILRVLPLLRPGGLVVLRDTNLDGVRRAAESFGALVRMDTKGWLGMLLVANV